MKKEKEEMKHRSHQLVLCYVILNRDIRIESISKMVTNRIRPG